MRGEEKERGEEKVLFLYLISYVLTAQSVQPLKKKEPYSDSCPLLSLFSQWMLSCSSLVSHSWPLLTPPSKTGLKKKNSLDSACHLLVLFLLFSSTTREERNLSRLFFSSSSGWSRNYRKWMICYKSLLCMTSHCQNIWTGWWLRWFFSQLKVSCMIETDEKASRASLALLSFFFSLIPSSLCHFLFLLIISSPHPLRVIPVIRVTIIIIIILLLTKTPWRGYTEGLSLKLGVEKKTDIIVIIIINITKKCQPEEDTLSSSHLHLKICHLYLKVNKRSRWCVQPQDSHLWQELCVIYRKEDKKRKNSSQTVVHIIIIIIFEVNQREKQNKSIPCSSSVTNMKSLASCYPSCCCWNAFWYPVSLLVVLEEEEASGRYPDIASWLLLS